MKEQLRELVLQALRSMQQAGQLDLDCSLDREVDFTIERTRSREHGDFACNVAMVLAKRVGQKPRDLANAIVAALPAAASVSQVVIAGPGFINFHIAEDSRLDVLQRIAEQAGNYGRRSLESAERVTIEFVSANPTGPLHVGHGRGAAYGATLANVLAADGIAVQREYYVNDAGRQMDILATSVWLRCLELAGQPIRFPDNGYRGDYVFDIARALNQQLGARLLQPATQVMADLPADASQGGDKETHIDALIGRAKTLLGDDYGVVFDAGLNAILDDIRDDLGEFGVHYDCWFSERSLDTDGYVQRALDTLEAGGHLYLEDGARWFRATAFGDEKDRVVVRENGQRTYFASDLGYLLSKFERGFDRAIYIFGADHHGYIARLKAAAQGLGLDPSRIEILLVQFAVLYRGHEKVQMSTRSGEFVTLRDLRREVGSDAARFFYVMRSNDQHLDFDLDLAKSQSNDNPVYYLQYAHARVCSVMRQLAERQLSFDPEQAAAARGRLQEVQETAVLDQLARYPEVVDSAARNRAPQLVANQLRELAAAFHSFYNAHQLLVDDAELRNARLGLCMAVRQVLANGLELLGVNAPERM